MKKLGPELFYIDKKTGKRADAALHDEMLNSIAPDEVDKRLARTRAVAREIGLPEKGINLFLKRKR